MAVVLQGSSSVAEFVSKVLLNMILQTVPAVRIHPALAASRPQTVSSGPEKCTHLPLRDRLWQRFGKPTLYFSAENLVGVRIELLNDAISGPPSSLLVRTAIQSGSI